MFVTDSKIHPNIHDIIKKMEEDKTVEAQDRFRGGGLVNFEIGLSR